MSHRVGALKQAERTTKFDFPHRVEEMARGRRDSTRVQWNTKLNPIQTVPFLLMGLQFWGKYVGAQACPQLPIMGEKLHICRNLPTLPLSDAFILRVFSPTRLESGNRRHGRRRKAPASLLKGSCFARITVLLLHLRPCATAGSTALEHIPRNGSQDNRAGWWAIGGASPGARGVQEGLDEEEAARPGCR